MNNKEHLQKGEIRIQGSDIPETSYSYSKKIHITNKRIMFPDGKAFQIIYKKWGFVAYETKYKYTPSVPSKIIYKLVHIHSVSKTMKTAIKAVEMPNGDIRCMNCSATPEPKDYILLFMKLNGIEAYE